MILCDKTIRKLCLGTAKKPVDPDKALIWPFVESHQLDVISYGLTSSGYDMRLGTTYLVFKNVSNVAVNPKKMKNDITYAAKFLEKCEVEGDGDVIMVPPHSYILGYSVEYFRVPRTLSGTCVGKSTYARCGIVVNTTPLEPGWDGHLTIEIANVAPCPIELFAGEGIAQVRFEMLDKKPECDYAKKQGKYQSQGPEPIPARVK